MNTITVGGQDYEVLPLDRISEITHAKWGGGKVVEAAHRHGSYWCADVNSPSDSRRRILISGDEMPHFGIQPLKLIEKTPVEFVAYGNDAVFIETHTVDNHGHESARGFWAFPIPNNIDHRRDFRCVEVTE